MKSFFAILLASVVLLMNVGLTISDHYCGGQLVSSTVSVGHGDVGCGMETLQGDCENSSPGTSTLEKVCCGNDFLEFQIEDEFEITSLDKSSVDLEFVAAFVLAYIHILSDSNSSSSAYPAYAIPLLNRDLQVMYQSFLI